MDLTSQPNQLGDGSNVGAIVPSWGHNRFGQIGISSSVTTPPTQIWMLPSGLVAIVAGGIHTCALSSFGKAWCSASNEYVQLGVETHGTHTYVPTEVLGF